MEANNAANRNPQNIVSPITIRPKKSIYEQILPAPKEDLAKKKQPLPKNSTYEKLTKQILSRCPISSYCFAKPLETAQASMQTGQP